MLNTSNTVPVYLDRSERVKKHDTSIEESNESFNLSTYKRGSFIRKKINYSYHNEETNNQEKKLSG